MMNPKEKFLSHRQQFNDCRCDINKRFDIACDALSSDKKRDGALVRYVALVAPGATPMVPVAPAALADLVRAPLSSPDSDSAPAMEVSR